MAAKIPRSLDHKICHDPMEESVVLVKDSTSKVIKTGRDRALHIVAPLGQLKEVHTSAQATSGESGRHLQPCPAAGLGRMIPIELHLRDSNCSDVLRAGEAHDYASTSPMEV